TRRHAEAKTEDENASTADVADTDAAEANTEEDRSENDYELKNGRNIHGIE
ncbi:hypothetical protein EVA_01175, partial [gut metagenome]